MSAKQTAFGVEQETNNGVPVLLGRLTGPVRGRFDTAYIEVRCPGCGRVNTHGWCLEDGLDVMTHRVEHCSCDRGGYFIKLDPNGKHFDQRRTTKRKQRRKLQKSI